MTEASTESTEQSNTNFNYSAVAATRAFVDEIKGIQSTSTIQSGDYNIETGNLPSGEQGKKVLLMGTLLETDDKENIIIGDFNDGSGNISVKQFKKNNKSPVMLTDIETPNLVMIEGKLDFYHPDEEPDKTISSIIVQNISTVSEDSRKNWIDETVKRTRERMTAHQDIINSVKKGELALLCENMESKFLEQQDEE